MKQLRLTTSKKMSMYDMLVKEKHEPALVTPTNVGEYIEDTVKGEGAYIHGKAQALSGFDIPIFIDGNTGQLDLPVEQQDILLLLPSGEYKCKAELCQEIGAKNKYLLTLYDEESIFVKIEIPVAEFTKFDNTSNYVEGTVGKYKFLAKVFNEPSEYGIDEGRVSKLIIWDISKINNEIKSTLLDASIVNYERKWVKKPTSGSDIAHYTSVMNLLENSPKRDFEEEPEILLSETEQLHQQAIGRMDRIGQKPIGEVIEIIQEENFTEKEINTLNQFFGDHAKTAQGSTMDKELSDKIEALIKHYGKKTAEAGDVIIDVHTGINFGHVHIKRVIETRDNQPIDMVFPADNRIHLSVLCSEKTILWTDFSDEQPFNRQGALYVPHRFSNLNLIKTTEVSREYERPYVEVKNGEFAKHSVSFCIDNFRYNDLFKTVSFGLCVAKEHEDTFINELRYLLGK